MRHEPKIMATGTIRECDGREFRTLHCEECGVSGGEVTKGSFGPPTRMCWGFDDDTGTPCGPIAPEPEPADTPVIVEGRK